MKLITFAGPPSVGKTSVILRLLEVLRREDKKAGVIKFDCLTTFDRQVYEQADIPVQIGLSGKFCPDHFYISNVEEGVNWGKSQGFDYLITESAGLCNRCSPYIENILAVCVIDCLSGIQTPRKNRADGEICRCNRRDEGRYHFAGGARGFSVQCLSGKSEGAGHLCERYYGARCIHAEKIHCSVCRYRRFKRR